MARREPISLELIRLQNMPPISRVPATAIFKSLLSPNNCREPFRATECRAADGIFVISYPIQDPVYPPCTSLGCIGCFWRFSRLMKSVTYEFSTSLLVRSPPPLPIILITCRNSGKSREGKRGKEIRCPGFERVFRGTSDDRVLRTRSYRLKISSRRGSVA